MAFIPQSTTGFSLSLLVSIIFLSVIVVSISCMIVAGIFKAYLLKVGDKPMLQAVAICAVFGGLLYLIINLCVLSLSSDGGMVGQFFKGGGFLFQLLVGVIYGGSFGFVFKKLSRESGKRIE